MNSAQTSCSNSLPKLISGLANCSLSELTEWGAAVERSSSWRGQIEGTRSGDSERPASLFWLQECTETFDHHWRKKGLTQPYAKFPKKPYWPWLFRFFETEDRLFIPKSREMMVSWATIAWAVHVCQIFERTQVIVQTQKEEKGIELVQGAKVPGYARTLYERQSERMKMEFPLKAPLEDQPRTLIAWKNNSEIRAVAKGADQIRLYHPTIMIFDEAAHLDEFEAAYGAAEPVCKQIIAVSSVSPGWFWDAVHPDGRSS